MCTWHMLFICFCLWLGNMARSVCMCVLFYVTKIPFIWMEVWHFRIPTTSSIESIRMANICSFPISRSASFHRMEWKFRLKFQVVRLVRILRTVYIYLYIRTNELFVKRKYLMNLLCLTTSKTTTKRSRQHCNTHTHTHTQNKACNTLARDQYSLDENWNNRQMNHSATRGK